MSDRDLSPFFAPKRIAVVGAGERATSPGGAILQMLRQAGYGGRVVPVNPKGGTIFDYESVTSIAAIDRLLPRFCANSCRRKPRSPSRSTFWPTPVRIARCPARPSGSRAGVPMFNDVEEMAEAAGLLARYPRLRDGPQ